MRKKKDIRQREILQCIYDEIDERGFPPTVREIGTLVGLSSTASVHTHLSQLEEEKFIQRDPAKPRTLELTVKAYNLLGIRPDTIPMLGVVTAGEPITAFEDATDYFPLPPNLSTEDSPLFMLTIKGYSMVNAGILDGDYVIVRKQATADNGDIVIAMTDEHEATCKRFFKEKKHFRLQPENDEMAPIILENVTILGKVISLYRSHI